MSVANTLTQLAAVLATTTPAPLRVFSDPAEAVSLAEFPCIVLGLAPFGLAPQDHEWREEALGLARHDYTVAIWIFVGSRQSPLPQLHSDCLPWPEAVATVLNQHLTLSGAVTFLGSGVNGLPLFTYRVGPIAWADGDYFGLSLLLPVTEKPVMSMAG